MSANEERGIKIRFDGPPGPDGPRFIEVENFDGKSVRCGTWEESIDGQWTLVITPEDFEEAKG